MTSALASPDSIARSRRVGCTEKHCLNKKKRAARRKPTCLEPAPTDQNPHLLPVPLAEPEAALRPQFSLVMNLTEDYQESELSQNAF